ncbi:MAG TPA: tRNA (adenosine(37)-N6)-threonylcarbamoyltransferase complex ATPase subunit type 1 TsaE [Actinomycetota bacterium]|nr:tRNA (adenosine(37)-N6)-threonylcarbamoyltransferase complex ATPase subunit type 1 TsaE [Actinomycetota bacterium]
MRRGLRVASYSAEETRILGACLAPVLLPGDVVSLSGDLGAGKTVFVQGIAAALGYTGRVTSPTFTLVHEYEARYPIVHMDIYRLDSYQEVLDLGFEELVGPNSIVLVEWGEAVAPLLPKRSLDVVLTRSPDLDATEERTLVFRPGSPEWVPKLTAMRTTAEALLNAASTGEEGPRFWDAGESPASAGAPPRPGAAEEEK